MAGFIDLTTRCFRLMWEFLVFNFFLARLVRINVVAPLGPLISNSKIAFNFCDGLVSPLSFYILISVHRVKLFMMATNFL